MDVANYRYFTTDLLTNEILAEIPFQGVSWGRALRKAGEFSGDIPVVEQTSHLDLYNSTMPGKTGLYVVRNGQCVWGGIIWSREYDAVDRTLTVDGAEFISYFYHRFVWKSLVDRSSGTPKNLYASSEPVQLGRFSAVNGLVTLTTRPINLTTGSLPRSHLLSAGDDVLIQNTGKTALDTSHTVFQIVDDTTFTILVDSGESFSETKTTLATVIKSIDTYKFVRDILTRTSEDFAGLEVPRNAYLPALNQEFSVIGKQRISEVARLTVEDPHNLVVGQEVVVQDVGSGFDGRVAVTATPSAVSFEYSNDDQADVEASDSLGIRFLTITAFSVVGGRVTLTTLEDHGLTVGDEIVVDAGRPYNSKSVSGTDMDIFDETEYVDEVLDSKRFMYKRDSATNDFWYFERDIVSNGVEYQPSPEKWIAKIQTETPHNYLEKGKVKVQGLAFPYDGVFEILALPTGSQLTYVLDRKSNIVSKTSRGGVVFMYTKTAHGFKAGETVRIENYGSPENAGGYSGDWTITNAPDAFRFSFRKTVATTRTLQFDAKSTTITVNSTGSGTPVDGLVVGMIISCAGIASKAKIVEISPGNDTSKIRISAETTSSKKNISRNVTAALNNPYVLTIASIDSLSTKMQVSGTGIPSGTVIKDIKKDETTNGTNHKVEISNAVTVALNNSSATFRTAASFTRTYSDTAGTDTNPPATATAKIISSLAFGPTKKSRGEITTQTNTIEVSGGGTVFVGPRAYIASYGGFGDNSDIGLGFVEETNSGVLLPRKEPYLGSNLLSVGEILEEVAAGPLGFEYRIDCGFDAATQKFTRTMVLSGYNYPEEPDDSDVRSIAALGADKYIFDYPGNISSFSISESAENAATRFWVTGSDGGVGSEGAQPMAGASSERYLRDGWPILDATEQIDAEASSTGLYFQAYNFLNESLPPIDDLSVSVNGSMDPEVGTYVPGDWCSLAFDDEFIRLRLASDQEPRNDILVRKIYAFKVDVPDAYGVPEKVDLELVKDEEAEIIG